MTENPKSLDQLARRKKRVQPSPPGVAKLDRTPNPDNPYEHKKNLERQLKVIEVLSMGFSIGAAADAAGITRVTLIKWRKDDQEFGRLCDDAIERGIDILEDEAFRRGVEGVEKGVWHQGELVGTETVYSDGLLTLMLRAKRALYRDKQEISGPNGGPIETNELSARDLLASRIASIAGRKSDQGGSGGSD